jgi:hypothetical protein
VVHNQEFIGLNSVWETDYSRSIFVSSSTDEPNRIDFFTACFLLVTCVAYYFTLKKEAIPSSKKSLNIYQTTRSHIPEDSILHNLKYLVVEITCNGGVSLTKLIYEFIDLFYCEYFLRNWTKYLHPPVQRNVFSCKCLKTKRSETTGKISNLNIRMITHAEWKNNYFGLCPESDVGI